MNYFRKGTYYIPRHSNWGFLFGHCEQIYMFVSNPIDERNLKSDTKPLSLIMIMDYETAI